MPASNMVLMLLIGIIFGGLSAVFLRSKRRQFVINMLLGVVGAGLGAFFPVMTGSAKVVDVNTGDYLLRSLLGAFLLVVVASLFRPARTNQD